MIVAPIRPRPVGMGSESSVREDHLMPATRVTLTGDAAADKLLSTKPLAVLIGMVLDQQVPMEWAFRGPEELRRRLPGPFTAAHIAAVDPDELVTIFSTKPALHRYPGSMAGRTQALCHAIVDEYGGTPAAIWTKAVDGQDLYRRIKGLPGFGEMKAKIFIALLGKQYGLSTPGWQEICAPYGEPGSFRSVADVVDLESLERVRTTKAQMKKAAKER